MQSCLLNGNRINICDYSKEDLKNWSKKNILRCPACGKTYEYCHGRVKIPYFRHMDKAECVSLYEEVETEEHNLGKTNLYNKIKTLPNVTDCILEGWLPNTKQRPDIMFKYNGQQYVIEYQCTPIASEYYERHELYKAAKIHDIWICGTIKYFDYYHKGTGNKQLNELEKNTNLYYDAAHDRLYQVKRDLNTFHYMNYKWDKAPYKLMDTPFDRLDNKYNCCRIKSVGWCGEKNNYNIARCLELKYATLKTFGVIN